LVKDGQHLGCNLRKEEGMRLSDAIEAFIKDLWVQDEAEVELKRNELAEYFRCAPSQINYVLSTRFTPDHGYAIESRRGGGGFIRIIRVERTGRESFRYLLHERVGEAISAKEAQILCLQLAEQGTISQEDADLMNAALHPQSQAVPIPERLKDAIRAKTLKNMLLSLAKREAQQ
jgi:transcriptional regulator CtsR